MRAASAISHSAAGIMQSHSGLIVLTVIRVIDGELDLFDREAHLPGASAWQIAKWKRQPPQEFALSPAATPAARAWFADRVANGGPQDARGAAEVESDLRRWSRIDYAAGAARGSTTARFRWSLGTRDEERRLRDTTPLTTRADRLSAAFAIAIEYGSVSNPTDIAREALKIALAIDRLRIDDPYVTKAKWAARMIYRPDKGPELESVKKREREPVRHTNCSSRPCVGRLLEAAAWTWNVKMLPPYPADIAREVICSFFNLVSPRSWKIMKRVTAGEPRASIAKALHIDRRTVARTDERQFSKIGRACESLMPNSPSFTGIASKALSRAGATSTEANEAAYAPYLSPNWRNKSVAQKTKSVSDQFSMNSHDDYCRRILNRTEPSTRICYNEVRREDFHESSRSPFLISEAACKQADAAPP